MPIPSRCMTFEDVFGEGATLETLENCTWMTGQCMKEHLEQRGLLHIHDRQPGTLLGHECYVHPYEIDPKWSGAVSEDRVRLCLSLFLSELNAELPEARRRTTKRFSLIPIFRNFLFVVFWVRL